MFLNTAGHSVDTWRSSGRKVVWVGRGLRRRSLPGDHGQERKRRAALRVWLGGSLFSSLLCLAMLPSHRQVYSGADGGVKGERPLRPKGKMVCHLSSMNVMVHRMYNGILLSHKKEWNAAICSHLDESRDCHTEKDREDRERQIPCDIACMWNLKKNGTNELFYKIVRDVENKRMFTKGKRGGER